MNNNCKYPIDDGALAAYAYQFPEEEKPIFASKEEKSQKSLQLGEIMRWDTINSWMIKVILYLMKKADMREGVAVIINRNELPFLFMTSFTSFELSAEKNKENQQKQAETRLKYCLDKNYLMKTEGAGEGQIALAITMDGLTWLQQQAREKSGTMDHVFSLNGDADEEVLEDGYEDDYKDDDDWI